MKRYDPHFDAYKLSQWMEPQEKGGYVLYEEAADIIAEKELDAANNYAAVQPIENWLIERNSLVVSHEGMGEAAGKNILESVQAIIAEKGKEIERLNAGWHEANVTNLKQAEQLATLQTKLKQAEKDAARYRWLRMGDFDIFGHPYAVDLDGDALDREYQNVERKALPYNRSRGL